jgi:hypothetical protein
LIIDPASLSPNPRPQQRGRKQRAPVFPAGVLAFKTEIFMHNGRGQMIYEKFNRDIQFAHLLLIVVAAILAAGLIHTVTTGEIRWPF